MEVTPEMRELIIRTAIALPVGAPRRRYLADTIDTLRLGQRQAQQLFGWGRDTIRKALHERRTGLTCVDAFRCRGRKPAEFHLPRLLEDIREVVQDQVQTDPTFRTTRQYCRLTAAEVRRQLIRDKGYTDAELPSVKTITEQAQRPGVPPPQGGQVPPPKKVKETDAIFANVQEVHAQAAASAETLRLSLDSKATVLIGPFSRGGQSRTGTTGVDHDFKPDGMLTPFGLFQPETSESELFFTDSKVTSDFMADCLEQWIEERSEALKEVRKLVLDLDNGPENSGQRSQWL